MEQLEKRKIRRETQSRGHEGLGEKEENAKDGGENVQFKAENGDRE